METKDQQLKYPIGQFKCPNPITAKHLDNWIDVLDQFPSRLTALIKPLTDYQLDTEYRPGGWTIRQLIHHIADSHHHSYTRFKWSITEDNPTIKAYNQDDWSNLDDAINAPVSMSLMHIEAVHKRLVYLLKSLNDKELNRTFIHPENNKTVVLKENIGMYAWHSSHHFAHIVKALESKGWAKL
ncbi:metal-dependent hydrolase [Formosa agariphila KMM 3901]|uniref:Metal-dependent hydrolase n=1 Tax=Formosa agariphila (strain DSM 15362 / KCTC 12365 / LMG 23005 / KMM 3901 / M-2Alg 35-1) TaxID=1347342 RepID=T2KK60_FORAG|nr:putative metal-dependent hydrolase [Formosa agariphila]CDF78796.1 metal-dependent hydrolase [Formosa agariphila KMM 3901]